MFANLTLVNNFEDLVWLFTNDNRNRGILRLNFDEAAMLWRQTRSIKGNILEIGRRHGGSTVLLAMASPNSIIHSVDISPEHNKSCDEYFIQNSSRFDLMIQDSGIPILGKFQLLFIDGDHSYKGVVRDIKAQFPQLEIGGTLVLHDALPNEGRKYEGMPNHFPGVKLLMDELIAKGYCTELNSVCSIIAMKKVKELDRSFEVKEELFGLDEYQDPIIYPKPTAVLRFVRQIKRAIHVLI